MYKIRDIKRLVKMLKMTQMELKGYVYNEVLPYYKPQDIHYADGFLYCKGTIPVMIVAHLDTVISEGCKDIVYNTKYVKAIDSVLGGDDRCGVFTILNLLKAGFTPHILFTEDEECGGIGATKFIQSYPQKIDLKYIIELDRKGSDHCVFYDTGNDDFIKYVESFGFQEKWGTFSDICTISPQYDIASVNLSIGYYNEHTKNEYINVFDMFNTFTKVCNMLNDITSCQYFDMQEIVWSYTKSQTPTQSSKIWYNGNYITFQEYYKIIYSEYLEDEEYEEVYEEEKEEDMEQIVNEIVDLKKTDK